MQQFTDRQDLQEWLDSLDYEQFWREIENYNVDIIDRTTCDMSIAKGVDEAIILDCIKAKARLDIIEEQDLKTRSYNPTPTMH